MRLHFAERNVVSHIRNTEKINIFFRGGGGGGKGRHLRRFEVPNKASWHHFLKTNSSSKILKITFRFPKFSVM